MVSKLHALFHREGDGWSIEDRSSRNGTWMGSNRLETGKRHPLTSGDRLLFGDRISAWFLEPEKVWELCKQIRRRSWR